MLYFTYADNLLGVETNDPNFRWIYGRQAPLADKTAFENCKVKFYITVTNDDNIRSPVPPVEHFQCFSWCESKMTLFYIRSVFGVKMAYSLAFDESTCTVKAAFGKNYYRMVRHRIMNLHDAYYLLSDLANVLLLKCGYLTMYCAAALHCESGRVIALFAPPNAGKSYTIKQLCETENYKLIAEDIALLNRNVQIVSCPWTCSYRNVKSNILNSSDSSGTFLRAHKRLPEYEAIQKALRLSDLILLNRAEGNPAIAVDDIEKRILILNKYLFCGYNSPIINVLAFFNRDFDQDWEERACSIMKLAFLECKVTAISCESADAFPAKVDEIFSRGDS